MLNSARRRWIALIVLTAVEFIILLDTTVVNIALPSIQSGLHLSEVELGWVANVYHLVFGGFLILGGRIADLFGRRRFFLLGVLLFTAGSWLAGLAPTALVMLAARGLQGIGAAIVIPAEQSLLATIFTDPHEFNRAFGLWSAMGAAGAAAGSVIGGVLTQFVGWPWIFWINVPIGVLVLVLAPAFLPESQETEENKHLDLAGAGTVTTALLFLTLVPTAFEQGRGGVQGFSVSLLVLLLLLLFVWIEAHSHAPLIPLRVFRLRNLNGANLVSFLVGASHAPLFYFLSLYLQQVLGDHALIAALTILPIALMNMVISGGLLSAALQRFGYQRVLAGGMLLLTMGLIVFARVPYPANYLLDLLPASVLVALGLPAAFAGSNIAAVKAVNAEETGLASGLVNTMQRVGSGLGIAVLTALATTRVGALDTRASLTILAQGFQIALLGAAGFALLGVILTLTLIRPPQEAAPSVPTDQARPKDLTLS